jgi:hypothetical protein
MNLQYISDNMGHTTAVQISIEDWEKMKRKYKELEEEEMNATSIPDWQIALVRKEKEKIANGTAGLLDWEEAKKNLKFPG